MPLTKTTSLDKRQEGLNTYLYELSDNKYSDLFTTLKFRQFIDAELNSKTSATNKIHLAKYMKFEGFSLGNFCLGNEGVAGNWLWGIVSKIDSNGLILKSLSILSPISETKLGVTNSNSNDKV